MLLVIDRDDKIPPFKLTAVQYVILAMMVVLIFRLARLQVAGTEKYETLAERNRIRTIPILAPRGKILDREGRIIVDNYPSFSVLLLRDQTRELEADLERIAAGLHMTPDMIRERLRKFAYAPQFQPLVLKDDITPDELAFVESHKLELPELETIMVHRRLYPKNGFMAHLIGYVGEVSEEELNRPQYELYEPGNVVGKSGVEQYYNDMLMGKDGSRRALVNSRGKEVGRLSETPAVPGTPLKLTIDLDLQIAAEEAIDSSGRNGAIVAVDPRNGEVVGISKAIYQSCDSFFYTLADKLGIQRIAKYAMALGLGQKTRIDLPNEVSGVMPSEEWKIKNFKEKWYAGETISVGIGQGAVAATPIQLARAIGGIASDGVLRKPHVAFPDELPPALRQVQAQYPAEVKVPIDEANWETITDAMANVVNPVGTAPSAHLEGIDFAGKTGSSQTISNVGKATLAGNKARFKDNGWFVGVTPRRSPEIVVAVLLEEGEHGYLAARVCSQVIKAYVEKQRKRGLKMAGTPGADVAAVWNRAAEGDPDAMQAGCFPLEVAPPSRRTEARAGRARDSRRDWGPQNAWFWRSGVRNAGGTGVGQ